MPRTWLLTAITILAVHLGAWLPSIAAPPVASPDASAAALPAALPGTLPGTIPGADHWAFQAPRRPAVPSVKNAAWVRNPIDAFIAAQHEQRGLAPAPPADKATLLRRVYLDLVGLPPTRDQLQAFLADDAPDAYERVVDQLLASPRYGQRWGRHWMDVWRYSDWYGYGNELRSSQRHIWRWRDWIVNSLNTDRGYDQMVVDMLAGDELAPTDPDALGATGFLARDYYKFNRNTWLEATIEHTSKAFLGVTMNCARCHDHKYDPIAQSDYYRFRAFFEPHNVRADRVPGESDPGKDALARVYDADPDAATYVFERGNDKNPDKEHPLSPAVPAALGGPAIDIEPVKLPPTAYYPGLQPFVQEESIAAAKSQLTARQTDLTNARKALDDAKAKLQALDENEAAHGEAAAAVDVAAAAVTAAAAKTAAAEAELAAVEARIAADNARYADPPAADAGDLAVAANRAGRMVELRAGEAALAAAQHRLLVAQKRPDKDAAKAKKAQDDAQKKLDEAQKKLDAVRAAVDKPVADSYPSLGPTYPTSSTGRRLALARWIVDRRNPLASRVAVNHIWMRHFGKPIVPTVFDFGLNGKPSTHRRLLDWLAVEFMDSGWSMKRMHRLIVTSSAYRMRSSAPSADDANLTLDRDNTYLWRMNPRHMEAEVVRDSVLYVAGQLDETAGGPEVDQAKAQTSRRRSIYLRHAREKQATFLVIFDAASPDECYRRSQTVVPQQALALANSPIALTMARTLADQLTAEVGRDDKPAVNRAFIGAAFECVLSRAASDDERAACENFLTQQAVLLSDAKSLTPFTSGAAAQVKPAADAHQRARQNLVHVLMNHSDFVTIR